MIREIGKDVTKNIATITSILTTILLLAAVYTNSMAITVILVVVCIISIFHPDYILPVYFVASLSSNYFQLMQGVGITRIIAIIIILGILLNIFKRKLYALNYSIVINAILVIAATFISSTFSYTKDYMQLITIGLNAIILFAMSNLFLGKNSLETIFRAILISVIITTIYFTFIFYTVPNLLIIDSRLSVSDDVNVNNFAMMTNQLSAFCFAYMLYSLNKLTKIICLLIALTNLVFTILSGSRSALIGITLGFLLTILLLTFQQKKKKVGFIIFILIAGIFTYVFFRIMSLDPFLASRFNLNAIIESGGTRRWDRLVNEIKFVIPKHFFIGIGPGAVNEKYALAPFMFDAGSSHNFIVSMLTQLGIIGFIIYMKLYTNILLKSIDLIKKSSILLIPVMMIFTGIFNGIGEVIYSERFFWNALALAMICITQVDNQNNLSIICNENS